jgi:hypothetical protein
MREKEDMISEISYNSLMKHIVHKLKDSSCSNDLQSK